MAGQRGEVALEPLVDVSIEPRSPADAEKLRFALTRLSAEHPTLIFHRDTETGHTLIRGASEAQLDSCIAVLGSVYEVRAIVGCMQVDYCETISRRTETKYTHKRQVGGSGQYAEVHIAFEPLGRHAGVLFENRVIGGAVPNEYVSVIERAVLQQAQTGVRAGFPTVDFKFTLLDGRYHDVDSSALAFEIAAKACFRELGKTGSVIVLEPVMKVEVVTPGEHMRPIVGDLRRRSCGTPAVEAQGDVYVLNALVPMKATLGYEFILNRLSNGMASFSMRYETHQEVVLSEPPDDPSPPAMAMRA